jgi:hypothetical protein
VHEDRRSDGSAQPSAAYRRSPRTAQTTSTDAGGAGDRDESAASSCVKAVQLRLC